MMPNEIVSIDVWPISPGPFSIDNLYSPTKVGVAASSEICGAIRTKFEMMQKSRKSQYSKLKDICDDSSSETYINCPKIKNVEIGNIILFKDENGYKSYKAKAIYYLCKDNESCVYLLQCDESCDIGNENTIYLLVSMDDNNQVTAI